MTVRSWMMLSVLAVSLYGTGCGSRPTETIRASGDYRFKQGNYAMARDEYAEIVARYPGDWQAQYMLGRSLLRTNDFSGARRALEIAYSSRPDDPAIAEALAEVMLAQGDESRLFAFLRERATRAQTVESHLMLARYAMEMNDPDSAQRAVDTAIQIDNGRTTDPYLAAASLAERLGQLDTAVHRLRQAKGVNHNDVRVREKLRELGEDPATVLPLPPGRIVQAPTN